MKKGGVEGYAPSSVATENPLKGHMAVLASSNGADKLNQFGAEGVTSFGASKEKYVDPAKGHQAATVVNMAIAKLKEKQGDQRN